MEVAYDSEVKTELFTNREGTIVGPEGTETIISVCEVVKGGYTVTWTEDQKIEVSKETTYYRWKLGTERQLFQTICANSDEICKGHRRQFSDRLLFQ